MTTLSSSATFTVGDATAEVAEATITVLPALSAPNAYGRIVHPTLGAYDYEVKPDEWMNIDGDAIIAPVWANTRTLSGAINVLWQGKIKDVTVEERWKALGGLAMPIAQLRMLISIWTNPVDPATGYVTWYPNYISSAGFKVIPLKLQVGSGDGISLDDVINYKDADDNNDGWVVNPVTFTLKLVEKL